MKLSIDFNWTLQTDSARVALGMFNIKDKDYEFHVGIVKKEEKNKIYWLKPGWFSCDIKEEITFDVRRVDKIVIERKKKKTDKIQKIGMWDIEKEWPPEAHGASFTNVPWFF
ncbi:hypothetical protein IT397_02775 [Candidatus Nomurabacteria bacterium]|nr:hypothetical protein [Candidatus Nomurabacteria bacterium]